MGLLYLYLPTFFHLVVLCIIYTSVLKSEEYRFANVATDCGLLVFQIFWCCNGIILFFGLRTLRTVKVRVAYLQCVFSCPVYTYICLKLSMI